MTNNDLCGKEVDLLALLPIIAKRRILILRLTLITAVISSAIIFLWPNPPANYEISELLKLPAIGFKQYAVQLSEIKENLEKGIYNSKISQEIGLGQSDNFNFIVTIFESGNFIKVGLNVKKEKVDKSIDILNSLFIILKNEYQNIVSRKIVELEHNLLIAKLNVEEKNIGLEAESILNNIKIQKDLIKEKKKILTEYNELLIKFDKRIKVAFDELMKINNEQTISSNVFELINKTIDSLNIKRSEIVSSSNLINKEISKLEKDFKDLEEQYKNELNGRESALNEYKELSAEKEIVSNFVLLQPPQISNITKKENKINLMIAYWMISLAFSVFLSLLLEFWKKLKTLDSKIQAKDYN